MTKKIALITGINGQDGSYLAELLVEKGYEVWGTVKRNSVSETQSSRIEHLRENNKINLEYADLTDMASLVKLLSLVQPDEVYNLAAQSHVRISFDQPIYTANVTGVGTLNMLEAVRLVSPHSKIYQASSSEMFGKVRETPQTEMTPFHPRSPYGVAKTFAHFMCQNYREAYGMHVSSGILFNHEGEYRGHEFVTRKITSNLAKIKTGKIKKFTLGDIEPKRDWGYAGDYVYAMWLMLQQDKPDDYVIATGETHSVKEFLELAIKEAQLSGEISDYVDFDKGLIRPAEVDLLIGDASKAKRVLGWEPKVRFHDLVRIMMTNDLALEEKQTL
jgi:GDPmannose 4,6-dehydratase